MSLTDTQKLQLSWEQVEIDKQHERMAKIHDIFTTRMSRLYDAGFYLEAVLLISQTLEHLIKIALAGQASKRRILKILGANDPFHDINLTLADDATLGSLIGTLRKFTGKTKLVDELTVFNVTFRKEVAHHIFDGSKDLESFEKTVKENLNNMWELALDVAELVSKIDEEIKLLSVSSTPDGT